MNTLQGKEESVHLATLAYPLTFSLPFTSLVNRGENGSERGSVPERIRIRSTGEVDTLMQER